MSIDWFMVTYSPITWWITWALIWKFVARPLTERLV